MGLPLTIQPEDDRRLEAFKRPLGAKTKIEVLRTALDTLEEKLKGQKRLQRLRHAAGLVAGESARVNREFQRHSLLKKSW
ncbi:MAG: hypothetical protein HY073_02335 [Deltaproteobacteria bacterium]|nr:hypothetical protein [Deltaproteobacteria bacterium]